MCAADGGRASRGRGRTSNYYSIEATVAKVLVLSHKQLSLSIELQFYVEFYFVFHYCRLIFTSHQTFCHFSFMEILSRLMRGRVRMIYIKNLQIFQVTLSSQQTIVFSYIFALHVIEAIVDSS